MNYNPGVNLSFKASVTVFNREFLLQQLPYEIYSCLESFSKHSFFYINSIYFSVQSAMSYFFGDLENKNYRVNIISNSSSQFTWSKILKVNKSSESNKFLVCLYCIQINSFK